jgi:hypothetical protein
MRITLVAIFFLLTLSFKLFADEGSLDNSRFYNIAIIQVLDKETAKSSILEIPIGEKTDFGSLKIIAHKCWQAPLDQAPESKILLEISEVAVKKTEENEKKETRIFYGWMFASSPSVSDLENPIYDLTALNCKNK